MIRKAAAALALAILGACAPIPRKDREALADPALRRIADDLGHDLESKNLPRREGSAGGGSGTGGGCGC